MDQILSLVWATQPFQSHALNTIAVHFLQDSIKHQAPVAFGTVVARSAKQGRRRSYNPTPVKGGKKYWKQTSKVICNPNMKYSGVGIIWNEV